MRVCSHCGFEAGDLAACPICGSSLAEPAQARPTALPAWEDPVIGFPRNMVLTWKESLFATRDFYRGVPWDQPLMRPFLYFVILTIVSAFFTLWWEVLGIVGNMPFGTTGLMTGEASYLDFFWSPFVAIAGFLIWVSFLHLFVLALAPERRNFLATARVLCYAASSALLTIVPFLGSLVGLVWGVVMQVVGVSVAHRTTTGRAVAIVLVPMVVLVVTVTLLLLLVLAMAGLSILDA